MPPPSFSQPSAISVPRGTLSLIKDLIQQLRLAILAGTNQASVLAAVHVLLTDSHLELELPETDLLTSVDTDARSKRSSVCEAVADRLTTDLLDAWRDLSAQALAAPSVLLAALEALVPLLGPERYIHYWWPVFLRSVANMRLSHVDLGRLCTLVVYMMMAAPRSAYAAAPAKNSTVPEDERGGSFAPVPGPNIADEDAPGKDFAQCVFSLYVASAPAPPKPEEELDDDDELLAASQSSSCEKGAMHAWRLEPTEPEAGPPSITVDTSEAPPVPSEEPVRADGQATAHEISPHLLAEHKESARSYSCPLPEWEPELSAPASSEAHATRFNSISLPLSDESNTSRDTYVLHNTLERILLLYSMHRPPEFFHHLAYTFHELDAEIAVLSLLLRFLHSQSMHTYHITATTLLDDLLACLATTVSTAIMSLGVACLIVLLSHVPMWLSRERGLPLLFHVLARALCWTRRSSVYAAPDAALLFTLVYGIFPCNLLQFVHKPIPFLEALGYHEATDESLHTATFQSRSIVQLRNHAVHPRLALSSTAVELSRLREWQVNDASDRMAMCLGLRNSSDTRGMARSDDTFDAYLDSHHIAGAGHALLESEHRFEVYLKEQLLLHIGRLHRERIADAASEADQQNLRHLVRTLRSQLEALQARFDQQRNEVQATNHRHVQWARELSDKLNTYREERRSWLGQLKRLETELANANATISAQRGLVSSMGSELFSLRSDLSTAQPRLARLDEYSSLVQQLSRHVSTWENDLAKARTQRREMEQLVNRWHEMEMQLANSTAMSVRATAEADARARECAQLREQLAALRDSHARLAAQMASHVAQPVAAPSAAVPAPSDAALRARNEALEREVLDLRAQVEQNALEQLQRERSAIPFESQEAVQATLFSPNTLRTPRDPIGEDDAVPPLSLDDPMLEPRSAM